jgi:hypothetical protein
MKELFQILSRNLKLKPSPEITENKHMSDGPHSLFYSSLFIYLCQLHCLLLHKYLVPENV